MSKVFNKNSFTIGVDVDTRGSVCYDHGLNA